MASEEIESKFLCEARDLDAVLAAAPGDGTQTRTLVSTYYDTPDSVLSRGHVSLRIRQAGDRRIQTLKRGEGFAREEQGEGSKEQEKKAAKVHGWSGAPVRSASRAW